MIIVGSTALQQWGLNRKPPQDVDTWVMHPQTKGAGDVESMPEYIIDLIPLVGMYATPDAVYTIKCSHLGWSNTAWQKHKLDVLWLKSKGCVLIEPLYQELIKYWKTKFGDKSFLNLDKSKEQFFTDEVTYIYDHDYLHELVASPNKPIYTRCLRDGKDVLIDKEKFDSLNPKDQIKMFREEITVIALERWVLNPHWKGQINWYKAYQLALQKTITNLTKGWATDFIVKNLEKFAIPDFSYFKEALKTLTNEEIIMDTKVQALKEALRATVDDDTFVMELASGDLDFESDYPEHLVIPDLDSFENRRPYYTARREWVDQILAEHGYEHVMQEGGGEGGSEYCEGVFKLGGDYFKASWSYYSHQGYEECGCADTLKKVTPRQETVTVYN